MYCAVVLALLPVAAVRVANASEIVRVSINDMAFSPREITIKPGDTVEWVNNDFIDHTATAKKGGRDVVIGAGKSARLLFDRAGTTHYFCRFHPDMTGSVRVIGK
jgi:plastocyanin